MHTSFLKKAQFLGFIKPSGHLQQEHQQAWLEIAGDSYGSSLEFSGFELMDKQESPPQELAVRKEDGLLKRNLISIPPGVMVLQDQIQTTSSLTKG